MLTTREKEILLSQNKQQALSKKIIAKTLSRVRNKAVRAIADLLFLAENRPDQFNQIIGLTKSGRRPIQVLSRRSKRKRERKKVIEEIKSKRDIERIERHRRAFQFYAALGIWTGAIERELYEEKFKQKHQRRREKFDVDLRKLSLKYPVAMLKGQFLCPKCNRKGLIFHGVENWLWLHYNYNDKHPEATFCNVGRSLPEKFFQFPFVIEPQNIAFYLRASDKPLNKNQFIFCT